MNGANSAQLAEMLRLLREIRDLLEGAQPEPVIPTEISGGAADGRNGPITVTNQRQSQYTIRADRRARPNPKAWPNADLFSIPDHVLGWGDVCDVCGTRDCTP